MLDICLIFDSVVYIQLIENSVRLGPLKPRFRRQRQVDFLVGDQIGLPTEFKVIKNYIVIPFIKKKKIKRKETSRYFLNSH